MISPPIQHPTLAAQQAIPAHALAVAFGHHWGVLDPGPGDVTSLPSPRNTALSLCKAAAQAFELRRACVKEREPVLAQVRQHEDALLRAYCDAEVRSLVSAGMAYAIPSTRKLYADALQSNHRQSLVSSALEWALKQ